jgi:acetyl esterase/lipase
MKQVSRRIRFIAAHLALAGSVVTGSAAAQIAAPAENRQAIALKTGVVPGANGPEIWYGKPGNMSVRNVVEASLLPVLPERAKANGAAAIVAPGGAFMALSWDHEGMEVARVLAAHGIAAFVLKYRLNSTPSEWGAFSKVMNARMKDWIGKPGMGLKIVTPSYAVDDAIAALRLVRSRASQWNVDPKRVGMIGFSAGARTTIAVALQAQPADRPVFIAPIYPPMEAVAAPADAPPMFVAMASNDQLSGRAGYGLIQSWIDARRPVEFHSYQKGGHGFGLGIPNTTTEGWFDGLLRWIDANGFTRKAP